MTRFEISVDIAASPSTIWRIMTDMEQWPRWTSTITRIKYLNGGVFDAGTRVFIEQPQLPKAVWKIFEAEAGKSFFMKKGNIFLKVVAGHRLTPIGTGTRVILSLAFSGLLAKPVARRYQTMMEDYLSIEAAGLKAASESA